MSAFAWPTTTPESTPPQSPREGIAQQSVLPTSSVAGGVVYFQIGSAQQPLELHAANRDMQHSTGMWQEEARIGANPWWHNSAGMSYGLVNNSQHIYANLSVPSSLNSNPVWHHLGAGTVSREVYHPIKSKTRGSHRRGRGKNTSGLGGSLSHQALESSSVAMPGPAPVGHLGGALKENDYGPSDVANQLQLKDEAALLQWQLEEGGTYHEEAAATLIGSIRRLSFQKEGCRVVQLAFKVLGNDAQGQLSQELMGQVLRATKCEYANYVIAELLCQFAPEKTRFVTDELYENAGDVARHEYGCRIIQRLVMYTSTVSSDLIGKLMADVTDLAQHGNGRHVVNVLIEHGSEEQKHQIANTLCDNMGVLIRVRDARSVMVQALIFCSKTDQRRIASQLLHDPKLLLTLTKGKNGHQLIAEVLNVNASDVWAGCVRGSLCAIVPQLMASSLAQHEVKNAKNVFRKVGLAVELLDN